MKYYYDMSIKRVVILIGVIIVMIIGGWAALKRPVTIISQVNLPGDRTIQLNSKTKIGQVIVNAPADLNGMAFWLSKPLPPGVDNEVILHVRRLPDREEVRTVQATFRNAFRSDLVTYSNSRVAIRQKIDLLSFEFERLGSRNQDYEVELEAPGLVRDDVALSYQIDSTAYRGRWFLAGREKAGSLGFIAYSRPTIAALALAWMNQRANLLVWPGLAAVVLGLMLWWAASVAKRRITWLSKPPLWRSAWRDMTFLETVAAFVIIAVVTFIVFWPGLKLFFFQDDIDIILRAKSMPFFEMVFTNHVYLPDGAEATLPIGFYRPISYSFFPWLMWRLFSLNALAWHLIHLLLYAALGWLIYIFTRLFGGWRMAAITTSIWLVHSTKSGLVYWLSSSQDLLASIFFIAALISYAKAQAGARRWISWVWIWAVLSLLSKEFALILPVTVVLLEAYQNVRHPQLKWRQWLLLRTKDMWPWFIICGGFLVIRTLAMGDPTLPKFSQIDPSYAMAPNPEIFARNVLVYASWSAENWLWPSWQAFDAVLANFMAPTKLPGPFYPGLLLITFILAALWLWRKNKDFLALAVIAIFFWFALLLPNLLMVREWNDRWLTLPIWGVAAVFGSLVVAMMPRRRVILSRTLTVFLALVIISYGAWAARQPSRIAASEWISAAARKTLISYEQGTTKPINRLYLIGVAPEARGTVKRQLLLLFSDRPPLNVIYRDLEPKQIEPNNLIIKL